MLVRLLVEVVGEVVRLVRCARVMRCRWLRALPRGLVLLLVLVGAVQLREADCVLQELERGEQRPARVSDGSLLVVHLAHPDGGVCLL